MARRFGRPSPAIVLASIALLIALGGTGFAAVSIVVPRNSVGTPQLQANAVVSQKVRNGSLLRDAPGTFDFVTRLTGITDKLSYQLNKNNKISQWMQFRRKEQPHRSAGSSLYLDAVYKQDSISPYGGFDWHSVGSPTFFFNARFGTWGYNWANFAYGSNLELNGNFSPRQTERVTSVGLTNCGNSMTASFSGWSRSAPGRLNTLAPSRSACSSRWVA